QSQPGHESENSSPHSSPASTPPQVANFKNQIQKSVSTHFDDSAQRIRQELNKIEQEHDQRIRELLGSARHDRIKSRTGSGDDDDDVHLRMSSFFDQNRIEKAKKQAIQRMQTPLTSSSSTVHSKPPSSNHSPVSSVGSCSPTQSETSQSGSPIQSFPQLDK